MKENEISSKEYNERERKGMEERLRDCRSNSASTGSNRASALIPGTTIPKRFYVTIVIDLEGFLSQKQKFFVPVREVLREEAKSIFITAEKQLQDYRLRHRIFKSYGCDPGHGFEIDYHFAWSTTDDGAIQLLRMDFLPIGTRAIDAEMDYLDGKLEEVDGLLKPVKE